MTEETRTRLGRVAETQGRRGWADAFARALGLPVGLRQFGLNHVTLPKGGFSAWRHWHEREDEFVYVLAGELVLIDDEGEHVLKAGDYAGFPAGADNAHHLTNRQDTPAEYLEIGTRFVGEETVHYPDHPEVKVRTVRRGPDGMRIS